MSLRSALSKMPGARTAYGIAYNLFFGALARVSPKLFYSLRSRLSPLKRWPDLKNPKTYADKMVWLNLYWRHPLKSRCADKYLVREYIRECGYEHILVPLLGVWDSVDAVDFSALPEKFALKCNHGCGCNIICTNKADIDVNDAKCRLRKWMKKDYGRSSAELHYSAIRPRIICEALLEDGVHIAPIDYKCHCFAGRFFCCDVLLDRVPGRYGAKEVLMDRDWQRVKLLRHEETDSLTVERPICYAEMIEAAERLAKPFPSVRVDFYVIDGRLYFGEMTFTSAGGLGIGWNDQAQRTLGELITLPSVAGSKEKGRYR